MNNLVPTSIRVLLTIVAAFYFSSLKSQSGCFDPALVDPNAFCPTVYDPVCGCDGNTYGNSCVAITSGITAWTPGECSAVDQCPGLQVQFEAFQITHSNTVSFLDASEMANGQIISWNWSFGDGVVSSEPNPSHEYSSAGQYIACLTVKAVDNAGLTCEKAFCRFIQVKDDCFDNCFYKVKVALDGTAIRASLEPALVDTPFFFYVLWSLDGGAATGTGLEFIQLIKEPGTHVVCATYPTGDFTAETCTVCQAFEVDALCVNPAQIDSVPCPLAFIPVCGCDGVTYENSCEAYYWAGVTSWLPGYCGSVCNNLWLDFEGFNSGGALTTWTFRDNSNFPGGQLTSWYWDFGNGMNSNEQNPTINFLEPGDYEVCLYASGTFADGTQCGSFRCRTIHVGACIDQALIDPNVICPTVYAPVCGCDGVTYENECVAYYHHGVTEWTSGPCQPLCINPAWIDTTQPCIEIYDPVCGCDGITYDNECFALTHGVSSWKKGVCCPQQACTSDFSVQVLPGRAVRLKNKSINAEYWNLNFGDGSTFTGYFDTLEHQYAQAGIYQICLEISNFAGSCSDTYCTLVDFSTSAAAEPEAAFSMQVQPNPGNGEFNIRVDGAQPLRAIVTDLMGNHLLARPLSGQESRIYLHELPQGLYILQVQTDKGSAVSKIMLQR